MAALGQAARAHGAPDALAQFRTLSGAYQHGEVRNLP